MTWVKKNRDYIWLLTVMCGIVVWAYTSFATNKNVEDKEKSMKTYVDEKHNSVTSTLRSMDETLRRIDGRVYDLVKEKK